MPVLDTTYLLDLEDHPEGLRSFHDDLASGGEDLVVPAQVAIEYAAGLEDPAEGLRRLREAFTFVPADEAVALQAALLAQEAFARGAFPGWPDIQIAATARWLGMAVVTGDRKHFEPLGIMIIPYEV